MDKDIFKERGRSLEEGYFRKHEARLIAKLRESGRLEDIAEELALKLKIDNPGLLNQIMTLGVTLDTAPAFLLAPPGYADQQKLLAPLVEEAKRARVGKVVLMTAMGANAADTPVRRVEQQLEASGLRYNIIRPNWFMQNFQTFWVQGINAQGKIQLPAGTAKTSFIDARDIAAVAVRLLTTSDQDNKAFDLTGPESLTHAEVARILSGETGRSIAYEDIEPDVLRKGLLAGGVPADYTEFLLVILGFLEQGYAERTTDSVKVLLGRNPIGFARYAKDSRAAWNPVRNAA